MIAPRKFARVTVFLDDVIVHLAKTWYVFNGPQTFGTSDNPGVVGTARGSYEETLCGCRTAMGEKHDRAIGVPTCVTCIAAWIAQPEYTIE